MNLPKYFPNRIHASNKICFVLFMYVKVIFIHNVFILFRFYWLLIVAVFVQLCHLYITYMEILSKYLNRKEHTRKYKTTFL